MLKLVFENWKLVHRIIKCISFQNYLKLSEAKSC